MHVNLTQAIRRRRQAGVTLLEAIVSMGIFGVSFFSLYTGMSMGMSIVGSARENLRATQVMIEKMETIRLYSWNQLNTPGFIPVNFTETYHPSHDEGESEGGSQGVIYVGRVTIGAGPAGHSYSADVRTVTIGVTWMSGGRSHNRTMTTFVSRHGLQNYIY